MQTASTHPAYSDEHAEAPQLTRLLRAHRERPHSRTAEKRDELAAFQLIELHSIPPG
jgi:hypothetical protein